MDKKRNNPPALVIRRVIHAKRDKVFAAWTKPEIMSQWFFCRTGSAVVTNDFRVGGSYKNLMTHEPEGGKGSGCGSDSSTHMHSGEYLEIIPPEKLVFTWNSHVVQNSRVTVELKDLGDSTELTLTHELLETEELRQQHSGGWEGCLENLLNYLG